MEIKEHILYGKLLIDVGLKKNFFQIHKSTVSFGEFQKGSDSTKKKNELNISRIN